MKEFLVIYDYQHGGWSNRIWAESREILLSELKIEEIGSLQIWENFRDDACLKSRFGLFNNATSWDDIVECKASEFPKVQGNN